MQIESSRKRFGDFKDDLKSNPPKPGRHHSAQQNHGPRTRSSLELIRRFFRQLKGHGLPIAFSLGTLTVATWLQLIPPMTTKFIVDNVLGDEPLPTWLTEIVALPDDRRMLLVAVVVFVMCVAFVRIATGLAGRWTATRTTKRIQMSVRKRLFEHAVRLPLDRIQDLKSGGVASILREDAGGVGNLVFELIYNPWRAIIQLVGSLAVLAWVDWRLLIGALVIVPVVYLTHRTWIYRIRPQFRLIRKQREMIDALATEAFGGMRVVRAFSRQRRETVRVMKDNHLMGRQELFVWWWSRTIEVVWATLIPCSSACLVLYGGLQVLNGSLTLGALMMFLVFVLMLLEPLGVLANSAAAFQNSLSGLDRILDLLDEPREMLPTANAVALERRDVRGAIRFDRVSFRYPKSDDHALRDITFRVEPGMMVALVGPSGSGKTTLCNLVARFYDPTFGAITLDGRDLRDIEVENFRSLLGVVEQDVFLFDGTIGDNICYADRSASPETIRRAAEMANALEFIEPLPDGFDTIIGERGVRLSGGQRQRLAIARAILADPRILILDEATSSLDTHSERLIQASLERLMCGRTSFVIAHRLSTITHADLIIVLEHGEIAQTGTHAELMESGGRYHEMVRLQLDPHEDLTM